MNDRSLLGSLLCVGALVLGAAGACDEREPAGAVRQRPAAEATPTGPVRLADPPLAPAETTRLLAEAGDALRASPLAGQVVRVTFTGVTASPDVQLAGRDEWAAQLWSRLAASALTQAGADAGGPGAPARALQSRIEVQLDDAPPVPPRPGLAAIRLTLSLVDPSARAEAWRYDFCCLAPVSTARVPASAPAGSGLTVSSAAGPIHFDSAALAAIVRVDRATFKGESGRVVVTLDLTAVGEGVQVSVGGEFLDVAGRVVAQSPARRYYLPADQSVRTTLSTTDARAATARIAIRGE